MSPQKPRSGNKPLVLDELQIPGAALAHPPVAADTWGINIAAARLNFPHDGLKLILPPWTPNMNVGDSYRIKINNFPVVLGSLERPEEVDQEVMRFIAPGGLVDGAFDLSYDVTRVGGTPEPSLTTKIYVKIDAAPPGGRDQDGDVPGHSELHLSIPAQFLPPGAVDKDDAAAGIPVTILPYPNMFDGDRIKLSWGGKLVWHRVTDLEATDPDNHPIEITVDEATIRDAGDTDSGGLVVAFEVYDVVDNQSDGWSAEVRVVVDTGSSRLIAPFIKEVSNLVLDMDALGDADLTFQIVALTTDFAQGDQIEMRLSGTTVNGDKVDKPYLPELITNAPSIVEFTRPSADVRALIGGVHTAFSYRLIKADGSPDLFSKTFSPRVIGLSTLLAAPIALDEIAGTLDPDLPRTQVDIPWNDIMVPGNVIMLVWEGMTASGTPYVPDLPLHPITDDEAGNTLEISVEGEHLKAIENGTLDLCYWLLSDAITRAAVGHKSLYAEQLRLGQPQVELPEPVVEGENGGVLDPADVPTTGTRLIVRQYDGQIEEDVVHILWWGSVTGRYRNQIKLNSITDKIDVPFTIRKALVDDNRNGTVQAMYWVKRANGRTSASAVLHMSIGAAMDLTAPSVKQATGTAPSQQLNPVSAQDALTVEIPEYGIKPGDQVSVTWTGAAGTPAGGSYTTPAQTLPSSREIDIPVSVIAYNLGQSVTVTYTVTPSGGTESAPSAALTVNVQAIPDISLPMPLIPQAAQGGIGSELDLATFTSDARVTVAPWPLIAAGQRVWLRVEGTALDGSDYVITLYTASEVVASEVRDGLAKALLRSELEKLRDGSTLNVILQVTFDRSSTQTNAVDFPLRTYTLKTVALVAPTLDSVKDADEVEIPEGTTTVSLTLKLSGTASKGQDVEIYDGNGTSAVLKGQATADANMGIWTKDITVDVGDRRLYAKALYSVSPVYSNVHLLSVVELVVPTLTDIRDSGGSVVDGTTVETRVTVTGTGSKGQQIQLLDGASNIDSPFRVPTNSTAWSTPLTGLTPKAYSIKARALYSTGVPDSAVKAFNVQAPATPAITTVHESTNPAILNGGVTAATSVALTGSASPGLSIDLFDNGDLKGTFVATGGTWVTTSLITVAPGPHSFTAKAKYGSEPTSPAWTFTVITLTDQNKPYIQQAENNGTGATLDLGTFAGDATVKVSPWPGIKAGQRVWLRCLGKKANDADHIITLYTASAVIEPEETNGLSKNIPRAQLEELGDNTPLTVELKIKFNGSTSDDAAAIFPLRTYTVKTAALETPTITNVGTASGAEVPDGGVTDQVNVTLFGEASKGQTVDVFDSGAPKGNASVNGDGGWSLHQNGLAEGFHSFTAKGVYGNNPESVARTFTVRIEQPFSVGPTSISISGNGNYHVFLHPGWEHVGQLLAHHIYQVPVTGGRPPYYYQVVASNPERVANVNEYGQIYPGRSAGTATVRVSDSAGNVADITVSISWVSQWEQAAWSVTKTQADSYVRQKGLTMPSRADLQGFYNAFSIYGANVCDVVGITNSGPSHPTCWFWEEEIHSNGKWWYRNLGNGGEDGIGLASMINSIGWRRSG